MNAHTTFRFAGEQYDLKAREQGQFGVSGTNGLYYLRARYYDPTIGRFLTRDPLPGSVRDPQSLNAYPYVQNNPVNRVDPTGMFSEGPQDDQFLALLLAAGIDEEVLRARACLLGYIGLITSVAAVILLLTPPFGSLINPVNIQAAGVFAVLAVLATTTISTQCGDSG